MAERRGSLVERYAWILVVANGAIWAERGISDVFSHHAIQTGTGYPPAAMTDLDGYARVAALLFLTGGALQVAVGATAFRRGEKWAWFALLSVPLFFALPNSYLDVGWGVPVVGAVLIFFVFGGLVSLGLLLSITRVFSLRAKREPTPGLAQN